ncbi:SRPBCC family protein [Pseudoalteromonas sp. T1lg88]|uniref:SRPBCC family protein n=1 Tax=Pseudoalteromonas sp. T1lg88 TaxID=2077104 RepID=UPI000CF6ED8E|nr:SRPBCC family protein [Pseudoalteromonas sp. T1lg88]
MLTALEKSLKVLVLILLVIVFFGLVLTPSYQVQRSVDITSSSAQITPWLQDLNNWPKWLAVQQIEDRARLQVHGRTQGVGAHINWLGDSSRGELSITHSSAEQLEFQVLVNDEYLSRGTISIQGYAQGSRVTWQQRGEITIPVLGPYLAWLAEHQLQNTITHSLNNLRTLSELPQPEHDKDSEQPSDP